MKNPGGAAKALMFALVVLALVASLLMLFTDSELWLKMAVIAALWAAFIGVVLVTRYSSALAEAQREVAEVRSREGRSAKPVEGEDGTAESIAALRSELKQMRIQLAHMSGNQFGNAFGDDEQLAVQAKAERIHELNPTRNAGNVDRDKVAGPHAPQSLSGAVQPDAPSISVEPGAAVSSFSTGTFAAVKWSGGGQDAETTAQIPLVVDHSGAEVPDQPTSAASEPQAPAGVDEESTHGRRRADDRAERDAAPALTVAELMARMKKN